MSDLRPSFDTLANLYAEATRLDMQAARAKRRVVECVLQYGFDERAIEDAALAILKAEDASAAAHLRANIAGDSL